MTRANWSRGQRGEDGFEKCLESKFNGFRR